MALQFLLELAATVVVAMFMLRFLLQIVRADFFNPATQAIVRFTNPLVMPLRKIIPGWAGLDLASLVATLLVQIAAVALLAFYASALRGAPVPGPGALALRALFELILLVFRIYTVSIFLRVLMSWLNPDPRNPAMSLLYSLTEPLLRPARRLIPPIAGLDLSPLIVLVGLQALQILITQDLARMLLGL